MYIPNDAILRVQLLQVHKVAELRWDRANELIAVEAPETNTLKVYMRTQSDEKWDQFWIFSDDMQALNRAECGAILSVQMG